MGPRPVPGGGSNQSAPDSQAKFFDARLGMWSVAVCAETGAAVMPRASPSAGKVYLHLRSGGDFMTSTLCFFGNAADLKRKRRVGKRAFSLYAHPTTRPYGRRTPATDDKSRCGSPQL